LPSPSQHVPIYLQQFPSYSNRKCQKSLFSRTAAHIFVSPGDAPAIITEYVAWMERQLNPCQTPRSMYPSMFNSFPVIRTSSAKNRCLHVPQPTFLFPMETPLRISRNMFHGWHSPRYALHCAVNGDRPINHRKDCTKYLPSLNSNFQLTFYHPNTRSVILIALLHNPICIFV